jgi:hypothetical protein
MEITLKINNNRINFNHHGVLTELANHRVIPDKEIFADIFQELAKSNSRTIRAEIARRDKINEDTVLYLIQDKSVDVLRNLVRNEKFQEIATLEHIKTLINSGDTGVLEELVYSADKFEKNICEYISKEAIKSTDTDVRYALADNKNIPMNYLHDLTNDEDWGVANQAKDTIKWISDNY